MNTFERITIENEILKAINELDDADLFNLHNNFCYANNVPHCVIYPMTEFDDIMQYDAPSIIAKRIYSGDFNPNHDYFKICYDGSLVSCIDIEEFIHVGTLAAYIVGKKDSLENYHIYCLLKKFFGDDSKIK